MKKLLSLSLIALLAGCATGPRIDKSLTAKGQSSRVKFVVLHYTVANLPSSIKILTQQVVSSHYLLTDEKKPVIYGLVDETRQANHAGVSNWKNYSLLNTSSIGIEIVNPGFTETADGKRIWYPFPKEQIDELIPLLKKIVKDHNIPPENIIGHADIAPQRKQDPGPMFPWHELAKHGLTVWPDAAKVAAAKPGFEQLLPDALWFQEKLGTFGYAVARTGLLDKETRNVITAFQMRFRPMTIDGNPDAETAAMLEALVPSPPVAAPAPVPVPAVPAVPEPVVPPQT
ncbi:N-acetylmuramoyl-L-alanine amidase [Massilia soli]|uniref:N-acetylmuramoyl-L-alanine amidase n=1 Tax=Massilia soli TaxID=2792854 RepID=A0ABS7SK57_9BURK|nr:N-acetylmuramoyl-L-alanine amidase [Massilia soli]MBZ2206329.1 N-acetylmuramoyl-L-alanine amidase [Massilia soli]